MSCDLIALFVGHLRKKVFNRGMCVLMVERETVRNREWFEINTKKKLDTSLREQLKPMSKRMKKDCHDLCCHGKKALLMLKSYKRKKERKKEKSH